MTERRDSKGGNFEFDMRKLLVEQEQLSELTGENFGLDRKTGFEFDRRKLTT